MVSSRQTPASATPDEFHPSAGILHDRDPVANDQASADRHLEMVQRIRLGGFLAVRHSDDEDVSWVESAADANRARYPTCFLSVRNVGHSGKPPTTIQRCLARRILAILHRRCRSTSHRDIAVCADDSPAPRINAAVEFSRRGAGEPMTPARYRAGGRNRL